MVRAIALAYVLEYSSTRVLVRTPSTMVRTRVLISSSITEGDDERPDVARNNQVVRNRVIALRQTKGNFLVWRSRVHVYMYTSTGAECLLSLVDRCLRLPTKGIPQRY